ncbi:MAG: hypothetical protein CO099_06130 [Bdellovibrio sp. CG_4_9_14_3_um_filter_39_7]|nr:MAG: hypothetical protein CO099_06130 [Bdellovibrio sp. CG_4_9_14_3_um_filter_39_7]
MKTAREWLKSLPKNLEEAALKDVYDPEYLSIEYKRISDVIWMHLTWSGTFKHWSEVYNYAKNLEIYDIKPTQGLDWPHKEDVEDEVQDSNESYEKRVKNGQRITLTQQKLNIGTTLKGKENNMRVTNYHRDSICDAIIKAKTGSVIEDQEKEVYKAISLMYDNIYPLKIRKIMSEYPNHFEYNSTVYIREKETGHFKFYDLGKELSQTEPRKNVSVNDPWYKKILDEKDKLDALYSRRDVLLTQLKVVLRACHTDTAILIVLPEYADIIKSLCVPVKKADVAIVQTSLINQLDNFPAPAPSAANEKGAGKALREAKK